MVLALPAPEPHFIGRRVCVGWWGLLATWAFYKMTRPDPLRYYKFVVRCQARDVGYSRYAAYAPNMASLPPTIPIAKGSCKISWYFPVLARCWLSQHHANIWMFLGLKAPFYREGGRFWFHVWDGGASWPHQLSIKWSVQSSSGFINLLCGVCTPRNMAFTYGWIFLFPFSIPYSETPPEMFIFFIGLNGPWRGFEGQLEKYAHALKCYQVCSSLSMY